MAIRTIVLEGDPILTKKCRPVENFDRRLHQLLDDMIDTLKEKDGVGLAGPQVGILRRVAIVNVSDGVCYELINPVIIERIGEQQKIEGCLSCPNQAGITSRPMKVKVQAQNRRGEKFTVEGEGLIARAFCHELDHLDGILFKTHVIRMLTPNEFKKIN